MRGIGMLLGILILALVGASLSAAIQTVLMVKLAIFGLFLVVATALIVGYWLTGRGRNA